MKLTGKALQQFYIRYDNSYRKIDELESIFVEALIIDFFKFESMWKYEFNIQFYECEGNFFNAVAKTIEVCNTKYNILDK